jgi:glycine dehydrogenase subunit 2
MIEPTETESKEEIDIFIEALRAIVNEAQEDPKLLQASPTSCKTRRMDETAAARRPRLAG